jgi:putative transposase
VLREREGREASPTAAIIDTQGVKTTGRGGPRGHDAAKEVKGRKRHVAVATRGLLPGVVVHAADIRDADGAGDLLRRLKRLDCWLEAVFAVFVDGICDRPAVLPVCCLLGLALVIVRRGAGVTGLVVLPRRRVVGRTPGWLGRWRRLPKDYEGPPEASEAMIKLAMIRLMLHRPAHPNRRRLPAP